MEIKFNNITEEENKIAVNFLKEAEVYFDTINKSNQFTHFYNLFNSICNNKIYDPNQYIMQFPEGKIIDIPLTALTAEEQTKINAYKRQIIESRKFSKI